MVCKCILNKTDKIEKYKQKLAPVGFTSQAQCDRYANVQKHAKQIKAQRLDD